MGRGGSWHRVKPGTRKPGAARSGLDAPGRPAAAHRLHPAGPGVTLRRIYPPNTMTRKITGLLLVMLPALVAAQTQPVSQREVLAAIAVLERDVTSAEALQAAETVTRFGKESEAVLLTVGPETLPWVQPGVSGSGATARMMLMAVYFAGDIKSQLEKRRTEDDPYSGWLAVIKAYRQIRGKQPRIVIPEVEELIKKEQAGTLKREAEALRQRLEQPRERRPSNLV